MPYEIKKGNRASDPELTPDELAGLPDKLEGLEIGSTLVFGGTGEREVLLVTEEAVYVREAARDTLEGVADGQGEEEAEEAAAALEAYINGIATKVTEEVIAAMKAQLTTKEQMNQFLNDRKGLFKLSLGQEIFPFKGLKGRINHIHFSLAEPNDRQKEGYSERPMWFASKVEPVVLKQLQDFFKKGGLDMEMSFIYESRSLKAIKMAAKDVLGGAECMNLDINSDGTIQLCGAARMIAFAAQTYINANPGTDDPVTFRALVAAAGDPVWQDVE